MRGAGIALVAGVVAVFGVCAALTSTGGTRAARADVFGIVQLYGNGSLVIETPTAGLREVPVDPLTVVREVTAPTRTRMPVASGVPIRGVDLRPGRWVALWLRRGVEPHPVAGQIDVWNKGR